MPKHPLVIQEMVKYLKLVDEMRVSKNHLFDDVVNKQSLTNQILSDEEYEIFCNRILAAFLIIKKFI